MNNPNLFMPNARREGLIVQELSDELLVYDRNRYRAFCLNHTAAVVWKHCDGQTAISEMVEILRQEFDTPADEDIVWLALKQLTGCRLLEAPSPQAGRSANVSRRQVIRRLGLSAALVPVVMAITAPLASAQASCAGRDQSCVTVPCCAGCNCNPSKMICVGTC